MKCVRAYKCICTCVCGVWYEDCVALGVHVSGVDVHGVVVSRCGCD